MKKTHSITLILILLLLGGCAVGPDFIKPEMPSPVYFRYDSIQQDSVATLSWWELFEDSTLNTLIDSALNNNKNVLVAAKRVQQAWAAVGYYRADMFPRFDVSVNAMRGNFMGARTTLGNNFYGVAQLSWELDFWGKYRRSTEAARAEMVATEYGMRSVQISLISAVAANYFILLDYRERLGISEATVAARDSSLVIIRARFEKGIIPEIDVNQAEIQREIAAASVPLYRRYVAQTEHALSILLGQNPSGINTSAMLLDQEAPPDIPPGLPSELLLRRPDVLQAEELYRAQNARVGVAVAMRFPSISLTGLLGVASNDLTNLLSDGLAWSIGGDLLGPLFNFNKNKRRAQIERFKAEEYLLQYESTALEAFREVEDALVTVSTLKEELSARKAQYHAAINAEYLATQRYDQGVTSYLEVLENQRSSFDAKLAYSQTYQELLNSYVQFYKVLGGGWITRQEKAAAEDPEQVQR